MVSTCVFDRLKNCLTDYVSMAESRHSSVAAAACILWSQTQDLVCYEQPVILWRHILYSCSHDHACLQV